jgi:hypothetical protein
MDGAAIRKELVLGVTVSLKQPDRRGNRLARIYSYSKLNRLRGAPTIGPRRPCPKHRDEARERTSRRRRVREGIDDPFDDLLDQDSVFALAHDTNHRFCP